MTTVQTLIDAGLFALKEPGNASRKIAKVFCCDLLSIAMSKAPENGAWVTVIPVFDAALKIQELLS